MGQSAIISSVEPTAEGFTARLGGQARSVEWVKVREITAQRDIDESGQDILRLRVRISAGSEYVTLDETTVGYEEFLTALYDRFPRIDRSWWQQLASTYGPNRLTLHGLGPAAEGQPSAAEQYLQRKGRRRKPARPPREYIELAVLLLVVAAVQVGLAWALGQVSTLLAILVGPMVFVALTARFLGEPKPFFISLAVFLTFTAVLAALVSPTIPTLLGKLLTGRLEYLAILGLEILTGLGVMLLPQNPSKSPKHPPLPLARDRNGESNNTNTGQ
jgi:hypothetical protein